MLKRDPLLSQVCHDLRAPLAAVTMGAGFVLQNTKDDARSQRVVEAMLRSCRQMDRLIKNFSDLAEIQADALELEANEHDARAIVESVLDEVVTDKEIDLTSSVPEEPLSIRCDVERIKRAVAQLVANAVEHAPAASAVTLSAAARGDEIVFTVIDHGPGIAAEIEPRLFDSTWLRTRPKRTGSGFGLGIARGFAKAHGGDVRFERRGDETVFELSVLAQLPR